MKKDITFIIVMTVFGAFLGFVICNILMSIAAPQYSNYILTTAEQAGYDKMNKSGFLLSPAKFTTFISISLSIIIIAGGWFLYFLNSNLSRAFKSRHGILKFTFVAIIFILSFLYILYLADNTIVPLSFNGPHISITNFFILMFLFILIWFVAGETGWAGDYSSWKMGTWERKAEPVKTLIMGFTVGVAFFCILLLNKSLFSKYFILVADVLGESAEPSYKGFILLAYGLAILGSFAMGVLAWLTAGLSPTFRETKSRVRILLSLIVVFAVIMAIAIPYFFNVMNKYDMNKKGLAEVVGIPAVSSVEKSLLIFTEDKKGKNLSLKKYPMQLTKFIHPFIPVGENSIAISPESLKKIEEFVRTHKNRSIYYYTAQEALYKGYFLLGDIKNGMKALRQASEDLLIARLLLIARFQTGVIDPKNLPYLSAFENSSKWHIGGGSMLRLARAYAYQGMQNDSERWVKKAQEAKVDMAGFNLSQSPVLTRGTITGIIKFASGKHTEVKVALLKGETISLEEDSLPRALLDITNLGNTGLFTFRNLGSGIYQIAVIADKAVIPYDTPMDKMKIQNAPGAIKLDVKKPAANLGTITIRW